MLQEKNNKITYPGLIAAWSAKGKTDDDADRAILRDLTGNRYNLTFVRTYIDPNYTLPNEASLQ